MSAVDVAFQPTRHPFTDRKLAALKHHHVALNQLSHIAITYYSCAQRMLLFSLGEKLNCSPGAHGLVMIG
jgi:hypothetical protein